MTHQDDRDAREDRGAATEHGGMPGDGAGRQEPIPDTGVYPFGSEGAPEDAPVMPAGSFGRSDYEESGSSELDIEADEPDDTGTSS